MNLQPRDAKGRFLSPKLVPENLAPIELPLEAQVLEAPPVEFGKNYGTAQIYSKGFEFAFMSKQDGTYKQACTFVYCKDFLHDAVWAYVNRTKWQIYSFAYDTAKDVPLDMNHCVFAFRNTLYKGAKAPEFHAARAACQQFLNGIEAKLGFEPSQVYEVPHTDGPCWLVVGDKNWQLAAPLVGLYTLFIRVGFAHVLGESFEATLEKAKTGKITIGDGTSYAGSRDCSYIQSAWKGIQVILQHGTKIFYPTIEENYPLDLPKRGASLHDSFGPVNFTGAAGNPQQGAHKAMPHWYRPEYWK